MRTAKTLIRLGGCPGWSESSLGAQPHCWFCHVVAQIFTAACIYYLCSSYPVRIWASLMKKPSIVFDIKSPPYVDTCMDVISQVFIECFSLEALKFSKDSSTHKMIFNNEMKHYKDRVKQFYKEISVMESQPLSLRKYLEEVNRVSLNVLGIKATAKHRKSMYGWQDSNLICVLAVYLKTTLRVLGCT